jgi:hypothetical protein
MLTITVDQPREDVLIQQPCIVQRVVVVVVPLEAVAFSYVWPRDALHRGRAPGRKQDVVFPR